jgi:catechol 2,3-dioxygenase-like lactoylglutathione lyase family enzyme
VHTLNTTPGALVFQVSGIVVRVFVGVTIRVADLRASERFYDRVLPTLGIDRGRSEFSLAPQDGEHPVTRGLHVGFRAPSRAEVDEFWRAGTAAGHPDDGAPGPRPQYTPDYYGSFLLDPDGNSVEGVHHSAMRGEGAIDHLWIRVADVDASKRFYADLAEHAGFRLVHEEPARVRFAGAGGSFTLLAGRPTENLHMTFRGSVAGVRLDPDGNRVELVS